jgi:hypothetical protein
MKARVLTLLLGLALACLAAADQLQRVETTVDAMGTTYSSHRVRRRCGLSEGCGRGMRRRKPGVSTHSSQITYRQASGVR